MYHYQTTSNCKRITIGICIFVVLFGFAMSLVGIYDDSINVYRSSSTTCPNYMKMNLTSFSMNLTNFAIPSEFTATKSLLSQWNWKYEVNDFDGQIKQRCPTTQHDVDVYINGYFAGRSDGKILSTVSEIDINDCHNSRLYTARTGDFFQTVINGNKIWVSFELRDLDGNTIAYVDSKKFFTTNIDIKNTQGVVVANLYRGINFPWKWDFNLYDQTAHGANPIVLMILAGHSSFSDDDNSTDICNSYFWGVTWTLVALGSCIVLGVVVIIGLFLYSLWN